MASRQRFFYLFGSIFGLGGGLFLLIGILMLFSRRELLAEGVRAEGEVIRLVGSDTMAPVVRFNAEDGRTVEFESSASSNPPAFEVGERIEVLYPSGKPGRAVINGFFSMWGAALIGGGLGLLFVLIAGVTWVVGLRAARRARVLDQRGLVIDTRFTTVERISDDDGSYFLIRSQWLSPKTGEMHVFESPALRFDPGEFVAPEQRIRVRIDPQDPANYRMQLDFLPREAGA